jgi:hypothetical protein
MFGYYRRREGSKDGSSVSLRSRIQEAQREAVKRMKREPRCGAGDKNGVPIFGSNDGGDGGTDGATPTVDEIRVALLRKSTNGKSPQ